MRNKKLILSYIAAIFGQPIMIIAGVYMTLYLKFELTSIVLMFSMFVVFFIRYCFFYFWNYEKIEHLSFLKGLEFFVDIQTWQIFLIPFYMFLQFHTIGTGGGIVLIYYSIFLFILGIAVFIYTQIKLSKYKKFNLIIKEN